VNIGDISKRTVGSGAHRERGSMVVAPSDPVMQVAESDCDMYTWQLGAVGNLIVCSTWRRSSPKIKK
jgi:hypothetical protein